MDEIVRSLIPDTFNHEVGVFMDNNFGTIRIVEENDSSIIYLEVRNKSGDIVLEKKLYYEMLTFKEDLILSRDESNFQICPYDIPAFIRFIYNILIHLMRFDISTWKFAGVVGVLFYIAFKLVHFILRLLVKANRAIFKKRFKPIKQE